MRKFLIALSTPLAVAACSSIDFSEPNTLVVQTQTGVSRIPLPVVSDADETVCQIRSSKRTIRLSDKECAVALLSIDATGSLRRDLELTRSEMLRQINALQGSIASLNARVKQLETRQRQLRERQEVVTGIAADTALIAATNSALIEGIEYDQADIDAAIETITASMEDLGTETRAFLASLINQYRQLSMRIDRSIPNYED